MGQLLHLAKEQFSVFLTLAKISKPFSIPGPLKLTPEERKIGLSIRALKSDEFRADWDAYQEGAGDGTATLGDHFRNRN